MQERLGVLLEKEDEMDCAVSGCNFFLKAVRYEAFTFEEGKTDYPSGGMLDFSHCWTSDVLNQVSMDFPIKTSTEG